MAITLAGVAQAFLTNVNLIAQQNDPQTKVTPVGFLQMLMANNAKYEITNLAKVQAGTDRVIKLRYQQRGLESDVSADDDCETPISPEWKESELKTSQFSKIGIYISDEQMRKYEEEATQTLAAGTPTAPLMRGLYETVIVKLNGLIQKIDNNLLSAQATAWGKNIAAGDSNARPVAFGSSLSMEDGIVKLLADAQANEIVGDLLFCGNGAINSYYLLNGLKLGLDAKGFGQANLKFYNDVNSVSKWGNNHFGAFAQGLVGFVDWNKNVGSYAGTRGGSMFFSLPIPVELANGALTSLTLDAQLKYEDCPILDSEGNKVADRGYKLILSKNYGLWNAPTDMFAAGDRLSGFNGALHYIGSVKEPAPVIIGNTADNPVNTKEVATI